MKIKSIYFYIVLICIILYFSKSILMFSLFNDFYFHKDKYAIVNSVYKTNRYYKKKYTDFFEKYKICTPQNFDKLPYLTKDDIIINNDEIISPSYKKCNLTCRSSCITDPVITDPNCIIGQSTGGTSGKSAFIWMTKYDAFIYIYTFMYSFRKNAYFYGDKLMVFYPANSYFTNEYEKSNSLLSLFNLYFMSFNVIDKQKTEEFVAYVNKNKPDFLVIFPFVLLQLCMNIKIYHLDLIHNPRNINVSGEFLLNCSLHFCKKIFSRSNIENTYGAVEFGEIAHQVKGDKNTFEVFDKFSYLENKDNKIVVTSYINSTFPIIRYVMEDIGTIVNKNGRQYITNLIGKNTNQIIMDGISFTVLDLDAMIDDVNMNNNIVSAVIKYDLQSISLSYIITEPYTEEEELRIKGKTVEKMMNFFKRVTYDIQFIQKYEHDYLKKFKIIVKKDNTDSEPVGGFFKY